MSGKAVRQQFMQEFRALPKYNTIQALITLVMYLSQIAVSICVGAWLLESELTVGSGVAVAAVSLFAATRFRGINNIVHECSHFSFCESRSANIAFGRICASMLLNCFRDYREEHMSHHSHLGDYDNDRDFRRLRNLRLEEPLTCGTLLRHALIALSGLHIPYYVNINLSPGDAAGYRILKVAIVAIATTFLILSPIEAAVLVWLPFLWLYPAINYMTDCIDHGGLVEAGDELQASRNLPVPVQLRVLLFPRNDCYHLIHHLFPQIPVSHFQACHDRLMTHAAYRSRAEAPVLARAFTDLPPAAARERQRRPKAA